MCTTSDYNLLQQYVTLPLLLFKYLVQAVYILERHTRQCQYTFMRIYQCLLYIRTSTTTTLQCTLLTFDTHTLHIQLRVRSQQYQWLRELTVVSVTRTQFQCEALQCQ